LKARATDVPRYHPEEVMPARVFALNVHAGWKCRHSGACCRAGWTIPVEPHARPITGSAWLEPDASGACPQFDATTSLCRIHRDHGEPMLPQSCHHFPRRALIDERGTFIVLSHFCPTAASLIVDGDRLAVVEAPPAFPPDRIYEGLDARGEWPPLLRPTALLDAESFSAWERYLVETLGASRDDVETTLSAIAGTAEQLRRWTAHQGDLAAWTARVLANRAEVEGDAVVQPYSCYRGAGVFGRICDMVPDGLTRPPVPEPLTDAALAEFESEWRRSSPAALRYLGARAFASWTAYQSSGIRTQVAELFATAAVLRAECQRQWQDTGRPLTRATLIEAVRAADWLLVHLVDRARLAAWLGAVER
jgi:hypothetical protein